MGTIHFNMSAHVAQVVIDDEAHHNAMSLLMWQQLLPEHQQSLCELHH